MTLDIKRLRADNVLSPLDDRFSQAMGRMAGETRSDVLAAVALVSKQLRDGHVCLDLARVIAAPFLLDENGQAIEVQGWPSLDHWLEQVRSSSLVGTPGHAEPLVLDNAGRLYLRRFWCYERQLAEAIGARTTDCEIDVDSRSLQSGLERLFPRQGNDDKSDLQRVAAETAVRRRLCLITGGPGTGKTSTVVKVLALLLEQAQALHNRTPRITLLAPTGKAAARLVETIRRAKATLDCTAQIKELIPEQASTIHRCLGAVARATRFEDSAPVLLESDVVLVDEASMVDLELMARLFSVVAPRARVVLLGDPDQLFSVEAGAVLGDICRAGVALDEKPSASTLTRSIVTLSRSYRHTGDSGIEALAAAIRAGDGLEALAIVGSNRYPDLKLVEPSAADLFDASLREMVKSGFEPFVQAQEIEAKLERLTRFRVLCAHRRGPFGAERMNLWIANTLLARDGVGTDHAMRAGEPVVVTRNDYRLELYNGDVGLVLPDPKRRQELRVFFPTPDGNYRSFTPWELGSYESAFAMSIHKSQGSEFDHVAILLPEHLSPVLTRELLYTAVTRARRSITLYASAEVVKQTIARRVLRTSGLRDALHENARQTPTADESS